ncbi:MAG: hypothetical protein RIA63_12700, partial [Cyclobacteriaceae bacterium]
MKLAQFFILALFILMGCNKTSTSSTETEEQTEAAEAELPQPNYGFDNFLTQFGSDKPQVLAKEFCDSFLEGISYAPGMIISSEPPISIMVYRPELAASYEVFTFNTNGEVTDHKVILSSEGGDLYNYSFEKIDNKNFKFVAKLDLSLYDDSLDGPLSKDQIKELNEKGDISDYYSVGADGKIRKEYFEMLSKNLVDHAFKKVERLLKGTQLDANLMSSGGSRLLPRHTCDLAILDFLLKNGANPNLPSVHISIPEYSGEQIPADFDIRTSDITAYKQPGYVIEYLPLETSLQCADSLAFYSLAKAGANDINLLLKGVVKWADTVMIKRLISQGAKLASVPNTSRPEILKLLEPITDGTSFGVVEYGEGGDMFETDLMYATQDGNVALVEFMLKTGADPNECLPVL